MEHDQEMYAQHGLQDNLYQSSVYSSDILSFQTPSSFLISQQSRQRFPPSDIAFRSHNHHNHHDHHEAEHVYNSPQLTLDPSTLDLRPSPPDDISISSSPSSSVNIPATGSSTTTTPTGSLRISTYNSNSNNNTLLSPSNSSPTAPAPADSDPAATSTPTTTTPITTITTATASATATAGVLTRRKARAALEQLQIPTQIAVHTQQQQHQQHQQQQGNQQSQPHRFHPSHDFQNRLHHQTSDMHDVQMQQGELQMHVDDHNQQPLIDPIHHHQPSTLTPHSHVCPHLSLFFFFFFSHQQIIV